MSKKWRWHWISFPGWRRSDWLGKQSETVSFPLIVASWPGDQWVVSILGFGATLHPCMSDTILIDTVILSFKGSASPHAQGMWKVWCHSWLIDMKTSIQLFKSFHYWLKGFVVYIQPRQFLHGKHKVTIQFAPLSCIDESLNVEIPKSWQIGSQQNQF